MCCLKVSLNLRLDCVPSVKDVTTRMRSILEYTPASIANSQCLDKMFKKNYMHYSYQFIKIFINNHELIDGYHRTVSIL